MRNLKNQNTSGGSNKFRDRFEGSGGVLGYCIGLQEGNIYAVYSANGFA